MIWIWLFSSVVVGLGLLYWLIIIGEGSYFGRGVVRWIYSRGASIYDRVRSNVTIHDEIHLGGPLRVALMAIPTAATLDVGTGTGRVPLLLAQETWFHGAIHGLDLTAAMLAQAQIKAQQAKVTERIEWHEGSGDNLQRWPDQSFGVVTCLEALEYFPRPRRAIAEMWRVLQPEGTLIISTWTPRHARWLPGKAWTAQQLQQLLFDFGCCDCEIRPWQADAYELVIAVKP